MRFPKKYFICLQALIPALIISCSDSTQFTEGQNAAGLENALESSKPTGEEVQDNKAPDVPGVDAAEGRIGDEGTPSEAGIGTDAADATIGGAANPSPSPAPSPGPVVEGAVETIGGIEFGAKEVFRIGDGQAGSSSCLGELGTFPLSGTTFSFEFEVVSDNTTIDIALSKICGVDYPKSNFVALKAVANGELLKEKFLPNKVVEGTDGTFVPFPSLSLNRGVYAITIRSEQINSGDFDDFIVGKINVKANKQVKAVRVFAE